jgi:hypothetical protein
MNGSGRPPGGRSQRSGEDMRCDSRGVRVQGGDSPLGQDGNRLGYDDDLRLVWCQALHSPGRHAQSCLNDGGQPTFSSREACEACAAPLRLRIARGKAAETTIECIARIAERPSED